MGEVCVWDAEGGEEVEDGSYAILGGTPLFLFVAVGGGGGPNIYGFSITDKPCRQLWD